MRSYIFIQADKAVAEGKLEAAKPALAEAEAALQVCVLSGARPQFPSMKLLFLRRTEIQFVGLYFESNSSYSAILHCLSGTKFLLFHFKNS